jgi:hypothetical protein
MSTHPQTRVNAITLTLLAVLGVGALVACVGDGSTRAAASAPAHATESAPALADAAAGAVLSAGSVHVDETVIEPTVSLTESVDITATGGRAVLTEGKTGHATALVIGGVVYIDANQAGLEDMFGVSADAAGLFRDQWIAVRNGEKLGSDGYDNLIAGMSLASLANQLLICGACALAAPATIAGQPVLGVQVPLAAGLQAPASARTVLYVTDDSRLRPVLFEVRGDGSITDWASFSGWRETVHLSAPAHPFPAWLVTPDTSTT